MIKETIKYIDYNGNKREEDFYFNLSKADLLEMEIGEKEPLETILDKIIKEQDKSKIVEYFLKIVKKSYGVKSEDGKHFRKSEEIWNDFKDTEAYSEFISKITQNETNITNFINGIIPKNINS